MEELIDINELCRIMKLRKPTVYAMVMARKIPAIKLSGRCLRFRVSDIEIWLESKVVGANTSQEPISARKRSRPATKGGRSTRPEKDLADRMLETAKREARTK